jgi:hypothetical protein
MDNLADCEVHTVIRVFNAQNVHPIENFHQLIGVYGKYVMSERSVRECLCTKQNNKLHVAESFSTSCQSLGCLRIS